MVNKKQQYPPQTNFGTVVYQPASEELGEVLVKNYIPK